nr:serine hydrolase domain-containing protein [Tahibacter harae]
MAQQVQANQQRYGIVGQAVAISHNGRELFRAVAGLADAQSGRPVRADDIFPVFSLSKLFVSTLVMQLVEQGKVGLDQPAGRYLPDLPQRWHAITLRQLLDHSSGLPEYFDDAQMAGTAQANASFAAGLPAVYAQLADKPLVFPAGSQTRYTQTNYLVLAHLLETHYGKPYPAIAAERIIKRLRLRHTYLGDETLPQQGVVTAYLSSNGQLQRQPDIAWPRYALGHAGLYMSLGDLTAFLQAVRSGTLVSKATLQQLWQPQTLANGQTGWFATGWEVGESGGYRMAGHDGGARVRVRLLFKDTLDGDSYSVIYLTNGSRRGVWSRTLVDSLLAAAAPQQFRAEALSEQLIRFALQAPDDTAVQQFAGALRAGGGLQGPALERAVNNSGYAIRSNFGVDPALPVFRVNTLLFPASANTWDSLAEAYAAKGDTARAAAARATMSALSGGRR